MSPFGVYVRTLRAKNEISMKTLAESVGVNVSYLSKLERGKLRAPNPVLVRKIAKFFQLSASQMREFERLAQESDRNIKLPANVRPNVYSLAHHFARKASNLSEHQISLMNKVLEATPDFDTEGVDKMVS